MGNPVVIGLVGVVIGALITLAGNYILQRAADRRRFEHEERLQEQRWEREDRRTYHDERIQAYKVFVRAVMKHSFEYDAQKDGMHPKNDARIRQLGLELMDAYNDVYTFASPPVQSAASELFASTMQRKSVSEQGDARETSLEKAHEELGVRFDAYDAPG